MNIKVKSFKQTVLLSELEGHSVERINLRQKCSDDSVNKTVLKPPLPLAARRQYVYVGFSRHKIPRSSAARWQPGQSWKVPARKLISSSMSRHLSTRNILSKSMHAFLSNLANRQTDKHGQKHVRCTSSFVGGNNNMFCGIKSYNTCSNAVFRHWHSPIVVLPLVYCPADDTLFEVSPEIRCSGVSSCYCCHENHSWF